MTKRDVTPERSYQGSIVFKIKRKGKSMDSRLKILGMTDEGECLIKNLRVVTPERLCCPLFVTPAIFKPGSMVLKNQKKKQKLGFPIKDFGNDEGGRYLAKFQA